MAIGLVIQRGARVIVHDEQGNVLWATAVSGNDALVGYTSGSVSIRRGARIYIFDAQGQQTGSQGA